jgi:small subunit ribosomal protein S10
MTTADTKVENKPKKKPARPAGGSAKSSKPKAAKEKTSKATVAAPSVKSTDGRVTLRIRVRAYESKILDASVKQIMDTAVRYDAEIVGPVPLPTEIKKYTVNRSSFIYKNTREQFEIRVHKRLIDIVNPNAKTVEALTNLSLPSGVDIDVKMM